jgi:hypothetical protein
VLTDVRERRGKIIFVQRRQGQQKVVRQVHGVTRLSSLPRFSPSIDERTAATKLPCTGKG